MAIDRIKNLSDAALLGTLQELAAKEHRNTAALRELAADLRERDLVIPEWLADQLEELEDDAVPLDGVTALADGTYQLSVNISRETYSQLLEVSAIMNEQAAESDAAAVVERALATMLELHKE